MKAGWSVQVLHRMSPHPEHPLCSGRTVCWAAPTCQLPYNCTSGCQYRLIRARGSSPMAAPGVASGCQIIPPLSVLVSSCSLLGRRRSTPAAPAGRGVRVTPLSDPGCHRRRRRERFLTWPQRPPNRPFVTAGILWGAPLWPPGGALCAQKGAGRPVRGAGLAPLDAPVCRRKPPPWPHRERQH